MLKIYEVQRMTEKEYNYMMGGGIYTNTEYLHIEAESVEEAIRKAEAPGMVVNKGYVKTLEEIEAIRKAEKEAHEAKESERIRKAEERKARKLEADTRKAEAMGLTLEEYRKEMGKRANITRIKNEIEALEKEIEKKRAYLAKLEA